MSGTIWSMAKRQSMAGSDLRDQEVLRANKELAAYFRGLRTEREARGALKIIKAFIRERERVDQTKRRPLPGVKAVVTDAKPKRKSGGKSTKGRPRPERVQTAKTHEETSVSPE